MTHIRVPAPGTAGSSKSHDGAPLRRVLGRKPPTPVADATLASSPPSSGARGPSFRLFAHRSDADASVQVEPSRITFGARPTALQTSNADERQGSAPVLSPPDEQAQGMSFRLFAHMPNAGMSAPPRPPRPGLAPQPQSPAVALPYRQEMERSFGTSFGQVAVHVGERTSLAAFGARAAAWSETVLFASHTPDRVTVAHELTHIEQLRRNGTAASGVYSRPGDPAELEAQGIAATVGRGGGAVHAIARPSAAVSFDRYASSLSSQIALDALQLQSQASRKNTDLVIPFLEGELQSTRMEAARRGLLSKEAFDASIALSKAMTQLQPAVAIEGAVDVELQVAAALAAQQLFMALQRETADEKNFHVVPAMGPGSESGFTKQNPYTEEVQTTTSFLLWSKTTESAGALQRLPALIHLGQWSDAFATYRRLVAGLDLWIADQLRKSGKGTDDEALGNAHQARAQLRTGLEQIAGKHATRLPALFHPSPETIEEEKSPPTVEMNVYYWKEEDGKYHLYDLTTPSQPREQSIDGPLTAAAMNTFFEEVARYPEGEVRYALPGGATAIAPTTGKVKWYEWAAKAGVFVALAGLALTGVGVVFTSAGISVAATVCFAGGTLAGAISAGGHLMDSLSLGTASTTAVLLDAVQIASSFASLGATSLAVKAGSAAAALAGSRYFVPLLGASAVADSVQLVAFTDVALAEMMKIQRGAGTPQDKERAMAVLAVQLLVTGGLTALSVRGALNAKALRGTPLEIVDQNGVKVLQGVGDSTPEQIPPKPTAQDSILATPTTPEPVPTKPTTPEPSPTKSTTKAVERRNAPEPTPRVRKMEKEMEREMARKEKEKELESRRREGDAPASSPRVRKMEEEMEREMARKEKEKEREQQGRTEAQTRSQRLYDELVSNDLLSPATRPAEAEGNYYSAHMDGPDPTVGLEAQLSDDGMIDLYIKKGPGTPSGGEMFNEALNAFRSQNVRGVRGHWYGGGDMADNWKSYRAGIKAGLTPEQAAASTFTGKMATRAGFTKITIIKDTYLAVIVDFGYQPMGAIK